MDDGHEQCCEHIHEDGENICFGEIQNPSALLFAVFPDENISEDWNKYSQYEKECQQYGHIHSHGEQNEFTGPKKSHRCAISHSIFLKC